MLNPFPIMWLALFAYFLLRLAVGFCMIVLGYRQLCRSGTAPSIFHRLIAVVYVVSGLMIFFGLGTQYAALAGIAICLLELRPRRTNRPMPRLFYVLLLGSFLSLFITGAGVFAFDLPL